MLSFEVIQALLFFINGAVGCEVGDGPQEQVGKGERGAGWCLPHGRA